MLAAILKRCIICSQKINVHVHVVINIQPSIISLLLRTFTTVPIMRYYTVIVSPPSLVVCQRANYYYYIGLAAIFALNLSISWYVAGRLIASHYKEPLVGSTR